MLIVFEYEAKTLIHLTWSRHSPCFIQYQEAEERHEAVAYQQSPMMFLAARITEAPTLLRALWPAADECQADEVSDVYVTLDLALVAPVKNSAPKQGS
jgi:hypothetical protein